MFGSGSDETQNYVFAIPLPYGRSTGQGASYSAKKATAGLRSKPPKPPSLRMKARDLAREKGVVRTRDSSAKGCRGSTSLGYARRGSSRR